MSVLKIKDQNGQWTDVLSIKGEKGDNGQDYVLTENDKQEIAQDVAELVDIPVDDVQINGASIVSDGVAEIPIATINSLGTVRANLNEGISIRADGRLLVNSSNTNQIKTGTNDYCPVTPYHQHESIFYGLAKASGDTTQSQSSNAVGTYTDEAKASIQSMLGVANKADKLIITIGAIISSANKLYQIDNTYVNIASALRNGTNVIVVNNTEIFPYVGATAIDNTPVLAFGTSTVYNGVSALSGYLITQDDIAIRVDQYTIIPTATSQLTNDSLVGDVQINGTSIVTDGVANVPIARAGGNTTDYYGIVGIGNTNGYYGISIRNGILFIEKAPESKIKGSTESYQPIVPNTQHLAAFYGLAKAAGDTTQSTSSNAVGTYTSEAQTAIKQMLGVKDDYDSLVVEVSGTDPVITGKASYRYNCGELYTLSITPPEYGTIDIIFTSGATPTVLTLPNTVKMPDWWAGIETNTTYEMCITDGVYCGVMSWAT